MLLSDDSSGRHETDKDDSNNHIPKTRPIHKTSNGSGQVTGGDYRKNICGYITKKIIREFLSKEF